MRTLCDIRAKISLPRHIRKLRSFLTEEVCSMNPDRLVTVRVNTENLSLAVLTKKDFNLSWEPHSERRIPNNFLNELSY